MPSDRSRRSFLAVRASATGGTTTSAGYTRSARSHSRSRPTRPAIATSPRIVRNSSIWVTFRLFVQPVEVHGTTAVSGMSRELRGPDRRSSFRMSRRNPSLSRIHACVAAWLRAVRASARYSPASLIGRTSALCSNSVRSSSRARRRWAGSYAEPRRLQQTMSALGAMAAVGSICSRVSCRTTSSSSVGRGASSSCARTAIRRACPFVSRCTGTRLATLRALHLAGTSRLSSRTSHVRLSGPRLRQPGRASTG
jgi:hypothetical protein